MRYSTYLPASGAALLFAILPLAPLFGQDDAMKKDEGHPATAMAAASAEGKLVGADNHQASGTIHLTSEGGKTRLHFTPDFSLEKGPDVYITLTNGPKPVEGQSVVIAKLTKFSGEQSFEFPAATDFSKYSHLVLWCKKYSVSMGVAKLASPAGEKKDAMSAH